MLGSTTMMILIDWVVTCSAASNLPCIQQACFRMLGGPNHVHNAESGSQRQWWTWLWVFATSKEKMLSSVCSLRNVLHFLICGNPGFDHALPLLMDNVCDIFMSAANPQFLNSVQNLKDFHRRAVNTPEHLFLCGFRISSTTSTPRQVQSG